MKIAFLGHPGGKLGQMLKLPPDVKEISPKLEPDIRSSPATDGIQLCLQHSLVLFHHIPQRNGHMLPMLAFGAVQTHGCLA